ncbi:hypothetical protein IT570_14755 [Candidatus Sumerlaeota bacterium]|nr:hypothetical protein [Candidatus Sumerlaeota bacterium]
MIASPGVVKSFAAVLCLSGIMASAETNLNEFFCLNVFDPPQAGRTATEATRDQGLGSLDDQLKRAKELGAHDVRVDLWGNEPNGEGDRFDWGFSDKLVDVFTANGIEAYSILRHDSQLLAGASPGDAAERSLFATHASETVARYKGRIHTWEICDESNSMSLWSDANHYGPLLVEAHDAIKKVDPSAQVVGMCAFDSDVRFIEDAYKSGARGKMDVLSFHFSPAHPDELSLEREIRSIKRIMERYGDGGKPLYLSELGFTTDANRVGKFPPPEEQAEWIVKSHLISIAEDVQRAYYCKLVDGDPADKSDGLLGLYNHDLTKKKSWFAYKAMTARLKGAKFIGRGYRAVVEFSRRDDAEFQVYEKDGEVLGVAWVRSNGAPLRLTLSSDQPIGVENLFGEAQQSISPNEKGEVQIPLTHEPIYLRRLKHEIGNLASIQFKPASAYLCPGEKQTVQMIVTNRGSAPLEVQMTAFEMPRKNFPVTFEWDKGGLVAQPGETVTRGITMTRSVDGAKMNPADVVYNDNQRYSYRFGVRPSPLFDVVLSGEVKDDALTLSGVYQNLSRGVLSGRASWAMDSGVVLNAADFANLGAAETGELKSPVVISIGPHALDFSVTAGNGPGTTRRIRIWGQQMTSFPPIIDGRINDWRHDFLAVMADGSLKPEAHAIEGSVPNVELGGRFGIMWDESTIYVAADITDKTPLGQGDSMELYLGFEGPTARVRHGSGDFRIGIHPGLDGKEPCIWNWTSLPDKEANKQVGGARIADAKIVTVKTQSGYTVEAAIPLSAFHQTITPGQYLGFDIRLNDGDDPRGDSPRATLGWSGNAHDFENPSQWGIVKLMPMDEDSNNK